MRKQPHVQKNICGAKTRKGTPCKNQAGFRTNHLGEGRCYLHGGLSTGPPKKNKNAVKTGEHEAIWLDTLEEEEKKLINKITLDKIQQIDNEIKLTEIRERRMLQRIQKLKEEEMIAIRTKTGIDRGKKTSLIEEEEPLSKIQAIEEALTRVQNNKIKLIETKHKLELDLGILDEERKARIDKIKADTNKITGTHDEIEDLSSIYKEIYGDSDGN